MNTREQLEHVASVVLDAAFRVHTALGSGLLESAYTACLVRELQMAGLTVWTEVAVPLVYRGQKLAAVGYRMDLLVEAEVVVEVKSVEVLSVVHEMQLVSYLKLADKRLGLLLNFNVAHLRTGIRRKVNRL